jgi:hypothetical protein
MVRLPSPPLALTPTDDVIVDDGRPPTRGNAFGAHTDHSMSNVFNPFGEEASVSSTSSTSMFQLQAGQADSAPVRRMSSVQAKTQFGFVSPMAQ